MIKVVFPMVCMGLMLISCGEKSKEAGKPAEVKVVESGRLKIGFYYTDSIPEHFEYYKKESESIEKKQKSLEGEMMKMQGDYDRVMGEYQRGMQNQTLSPNQIQGFEARLRGMQEKMMIFERDRLGKFQEEQIKATEVLTNKVDDYGARFAKERGLNLLLARAKGSPVAYVDSTFDVTSDFIDFMNAQEKELDSKAE